MSAQTWVTPMMLTSSCAVAFGVLLLDQLREDALEIGQLHQLCQFSRGGIRENRSAGDHDHSIADLFNDLKHMRDVEDGFPFGRRGLAAGL